MMLVLTSPDAGVRRVQVPRLDETQTTKALTVKQVSGSGGTMHGSTRVQLSLDGGTRVDLPRERGADIQVPAVDAVLALDGGFLLVGWLSGGSPYQSEDLRVVNDALEQTGKLEWFTLRSEAGLLLQRDAEGWSVGVPSGTTSEESSLRIDEKKVRLAFTDFVMTDTTWSYCPPFQKPFAAPKRVAWFRVTAAGFQKP